MTGCVIRTKDLLPATGPPPPPPCPPHPGAGSAGGYPAVSSKLASASVGRVDRSPARRCGLSVAGNNLPVGSSRPAWYAACKNRELVFPIPAMAVVSRRSRPLSLPCCQAVNIPPSAALSSALAAREGGYRPAGLGGRGPLLLPSLTCMLPPPAGGRPVCRSSVLVYDRSRRLGIAQLVPPSGTSVSFVACRGCPSRSLTDRGTARRLGQLFLRPPVFGRSCCRRNPPEL